MLNRNNLIKLKTKNIVDYNTCELSDITKIELNDSNLAIDKICEFMQKVSNPYVFRIGDTPVKVIFSENAPTIQESLLRAINQT